MRNPPVTIVIPTYNAEETIAACLEGLYARTQYPDWEVLVVDDGSTDQTRTKIKERPKLRVLCRPHLGIAAALNAGFAAAGARDVVRLHADVVIETPDWLEQLAQTASSKPQAGVVGVRLVYPDGRIQAEGRNIINGLGFHPRHRNRKAFVPEGGAGSPVEVDSVPGALAYYRRDALKAIGRLDEKYGPVWTEDDDFCVAARFHGFKVFVQPSVTAVHYTRCWGPGTFARLTGTEPLLRQITWGAKQQVERAQAAYWESKWGWNPFYPDLNEIRRLYGHTEICWQIGDAMRYRPASEFPTVDCCLVTANSQSLLKRCLESLAATDYPQDRLHVYIADNGSTDGTIEYLESLQGKYPLRLSVNKLPLNAGVAVGLNWAVIQGSGELMARLDDDIVLPPNWLKVMVADLKNRPYAACVGPKILNDDAHRSIQCGAFRHFPGLYGHEDERDSGQADYLARAIHVRGCCNLYRRDIFARCGMFDLRYSPSQFDDPDHHLAVAAAGYEILYDGRVGVVHKLNNGLARSYAALSNQQGNAAKMYGKWGSDVFEVLEKSLDLSREGRYLPDDGDTSSAFLDAPEPGSFPRRNAPAPRQAHEIAALIAQEFSRPAFLEEINRLAADHVKLAEAQRRDGVLRQAVDTLNSALQFAPYNVNLLEALAATYRHTGQPALSTRVAQRALHLAPLHPGLKALADQSVTPTSGHAVATDPSDHVGEANVSIRAGSISTGQAHRLRVLMVNSFENRTPGGDMHQLKKTKQYLERLGVLVEVCCSPRPDPRGFDLVHIYNLWFPHQTLAQAKAIRLLAPRIPFVMSPIYWDMSEKAWADTAVPQIFARAGNAKELEMRLAQLASDELLVNDRRRSNPGEPNFNGYKQYQTRLLELVDHLLPQSVAEIRNLKQTLGVEKPYTLVFNGAETSVFESATPDWFVDQFKLRDFVLTVGLVEPRKNQLMLLHALRNAGLPVVVLGRNYDPNYLRLCRKFAPPNTLFIEHLPHEQLASAFKAARIHALPSWMECASFANVEAALSGCSLVVSDRTSEREYFGDNAYYCDPANVDSIRKAVQTAWRNHSSDAPKRQRLQAQFLSKYTWAKAAEQTLRGYEAALAARKTTSPDRALARQPVTGASSSPVIQNTAHVSRPDHNVAPSVSIIIPTFNRLDLTRACLKAVADNTPPDTYELVIVDNGSTDGTREFLVEEQRNDRLQTILNPTNRGFAIACNQGAKAARGKYLLFLNNDTEAQPGWLSALMRVAEADSSVGAIGSKLLFPNSTIQHAGVLILDDRRAGDPLRAQHAFAQAPANLPEANQPMIYQALTAACLLVPRELFQKLGGFDDQFWNGYEDIDFCFRIAESGKTAVYQPESLLIHRESQSGPERFRKAPQNIARLHQKWLGRIHPDFILGPDGQITKTQTSRVRQYSVPTKPTEVPSRCAASIIILALNQLEDTRRCLESVAAYTKIPHEVIIVDNGSTDGTPQFLNQWSAAHPNCTVILNSRNRGFAAGNNQALSIAVGDNLVLLNNDTAVTEGWLEGMLRVLELHPETGLVGPMSNNVSGPQFTGGVPYRNLAEMPSFARHWSQSHHDHSIETPRAVGFCLLMRKAVLERIGGLDERFGSGNFEDDDLCIRARIAGFRIRISQGVFIHHTGSQTFKGARIDYRQAMLRNWELFRNKWRLPHTATLEIGYPVPDRLPDGVCLKVELPSLNSMHTSHGNNRWEENSLIQTANSNPGVTHNHKPLPSVAKVGELATPRSLLQSQDLPGAWAATIEAIRHRPFHPEAYLLLAEIASACGQPATSRQCAQIARNLAPDWKRARQFSPKPCQKKPQPDWLIIPQSKTRQTTAGVQPHSHISVCIIARNEEKYLSQCLSSIKELASQIVVVDTGSTDRTIEIAKSFGAEVHLFDWCDDFSAARNAALEHARGDWVLILDADEELRPEQHGRLRADIKNRKVIASRLPLINCGQEAEGRSCVPRLFRNVPGVYFSSRIHEQVFPSLIALGKVWGLGTGLGTAQILHHGYAKDTVKDRNKIERNLGLLRRAIAESPEDANLAMNLGLETVRSGDLEGGLLHYRRAFNLMAAKLAEDTAPELREALLTQFTSHLYKRRAHHEVVAVLTSPMTKAAGLTASLHFALGLAFFELGQHAEAAEQLRQCLEKRGQAALTPINTDILTAAPYHCLAMSLAKHGDVAGAERAFQSGMNEKGRGEELRLDYARFLSEQNRPVDALHRLHEIVAANAQSSAAWHLGGQIALAQPDFLEFALDWTGEAITHLPEDNEVAAQRAEALLLNQRTGEAREAWQALYEKESHPRFLTALLVCELIELGIITTPDAYESGLGPSSRAFIEWYRRFVTMRCQNILTRLNESIEPLRSVLPAAAGMLEAALIEAATQPIATSQPCLA